MNPSLRFATLAATLTLAACAGLPSAPPAADLPIVTFPQSPPAGDFVYRLPGGQPIPAEVIIDGSALASGARQTLSVTLPSDLYLHKQWASDDGVHWREARDLLDVVLKMELPSHAHPAPGQIHLTVNRQETH